MTRASDPALRPGQWRAGGCAGSTAVGLLVTDLAVGAVNYGGVPATLDEVRGVCPIVASYGGDDERFAADGRRLNEFLDELNVRHDVRIYDGVLTGADVAALANPVPEPATALSLLAGLSALVATRRRRPQ